LVARLAQVVRNRAAPRHERRSAHVGRPGRANLIAGMEASENGPQLLDEAVEPRRGLTEVR